jgi:ABC-2 type transport system permease protein
LEPEPLLAPRFYGRWNGRGCWSLVHRNLQRYWRYGIESIGGPIVSSLLFLAVFVLALGGRGEVGGGLTFVQFVAPGIAMFALMHSGFGNGATPLVHDKHEGMIQDVLAAPLTAFEIAAGYGLSATLNALVTGLAVLAATLPFVALPFGQPLLALAFALAGAALFALAGVLIGLWADKWEHYSAAETFLVLPLGVLSGAFFPLDGLPAAARTLILFNPAFHAIDGVRYGLTGHAAWAPGASLAILLIVDLALAALAWRLFVVGYKIKP